MSAASKTLANTGASTATRNVPDIQVHGNPYAWECICKAWSPAEGWMKSTKAMEIPGLGVLVQVTTESEKGHAEALTFVPGAEIVRVEWFEGDSDEPRTRLEIRGIYEGLK